MERIQFPLQYVPSYSRANYLMKAWDNLIANEDRNWGDILITEDWRLILIDHSRAFRTSKKFTRKLVRMAEGKKKPIKELPRAFVEKLRSLDFEMIRKAVGEYLTDKEIEAILVRRDLILQDVDRLIIKYGENKFLY